MYKQCEDNTRKGDERFIKKDKNTRGSISERSRKSLNKFTVSMQRSVNADGPMGDVLSVHSLYTALGQFLYRIGFQFEYYVLCFNRAMQSFGTFFWKYFLIFALIAWSAVKKILGFLLNDFIEFIKKIIGAVKNTRAIVVQEREKGTAHTVWQSTKYLAGGVLRHRKIWLGLTSYLLPIGAALVFVYTVNTMMDYKFALSVNYNGEQIGNIENELIFEQAQALVRERIRTTGNEEAFAAYPDLSIAVTSDTLTGREVLADNIVRTSSDKIQQATGIMVDGALLGVTTDGNILRTTLDGILNEYKNPENPEMRVEFVNNVELIDGLYYTVSLSETQNILNTLTGEVEGQKIYAVQKGDSPSGIAQKNGLPLNELYSLNPKMLEKGYKMPIGDELTISRQENFLKVKTIETIVYEEEISFAVEQEKTDSLYEKQTKVVQKGQKGLDRVTADRVSIDGVLIETNELSRETLREPVVQKEQVGTKSLATAGASATGTGSMMFPVPGYSYITTRFGQGGHRGVDICAPYGTPVFAADSGTVVEAGWHYSWGNYIKINHGNGYLTLYAHNSALYVGSGQIVARGQPIAAVGSTGNSSGNHCHLELYAGGRLVNPLSYVG